MRDAPHRPGRPPPATVDPAAWASEQDAYRLRRRANVIAASIFLALNLTVLVALMPAIFASVDTVLAPLEHVHPGHH